MRFERPRRKLVRRSGTAAIRLKGSTWYSKAVSTGAPALIASALVAAGWLIRIPDPRIHLEAVAETLTLDIPAPQLARPDTVDGFPPLKRLLVEDLQEVRSDVEQMSVKLDSHRAGRIEFVGGSFNLSHIDIGVRPSEQSYSLRASRAGAALIVDLFKSTPTLFVTKEASARASLAFNGIVREGPPKAASVELVGGATTKITMLPADTKFQMTLLTSHPLALRFEREDFNAQGDSYRTPTIRSGNLSFENGSKKWDLSAGVRLDLSHLDGLANVKTNTDGIQLVFDGSAGVVRINDGATMKDIRPNLIDWVSSDPSIKLFWTSFVFVSGLVLSCLRFMLTE